MSRSRRGAFVWGLLAAARLLQSARDGPLRALASAIAAIVTMVGVLVYEHTAPAAAAAWRCVVVS